MSRPVDVFSFTPARANISEGMDIGIVEEDSGAILDGVDMLMQDAQQGTLFSVYTATSESAIQTGNVVHWHLLRDYNTLTPEPQQRAWLNTEKEGGEALNESDWTQLLNILGNIAVNNAGIAPTAGLLLVTHHPMPESQAILPASKDFPEYPTISRRIHTLPATPTATGVTNIFGARRDK
jgi:hypothetical protein